MKIAIHQPAYFPWLGYLEKIKNSDQFIYLDTVSFSKNSFDNRNRIPDEKNRSKWLTVPIKNSGRLGQIYTDCEPDNYNWLVSHLDILKQRYSSEKYFNVYFPKLCDYFKKIDKSMNLADINFILLKFFLESFEIKLKNPIVRMSEFKHIKGKGSDLILNICRNFKADEYYSGRKGFDYLIFKDFELANIELTFQDYIPESIWSSIHQLFTKGPIL